MCFALAKRGASMKQKGILQIREKPFGNWLRTFSAQRGKRNQSDGLDGNRIRIWINIRLKQGH